MNYLLKTLFTAAVTLSFPAAIGSAVPKGAMNSPIISGDYGDGMLIAIDPSTSIISGYFQSQTGEGQFSCIFYLTGKMRTPNTSITTYFPEMASNVINGILVSQGSKKFTVRLAEEHGGCWNVRHFADKDQPAEFELQTAYPWIAVAVVKQKKAYFFDTPTSASHRKAYVVQNDSVGVRTVRGQWLEVDFVAGNKPISGWLKQSDLYRLSKGS